MWHGASVGFRTGALVETQDQLYLARLPVSIPRGAQRDLPVASGHHHVHVSLSAPLLPPPRVRSRLI